MSGLTPEQEAWALEGWATNQSVPSKEQTQAALQALEFWKNKAKKLEETIAYMERNNES